MYVGFSALFMTEPPSHWKAVSTSKWSRAFCSLSCSLASPPLRSREKSRISTGTLLFSLLALLSNFICLNGSPPNQTGSNALTVYKATQVIWYRFPNTQCGAIASVSQSELRKPVSLRDTGSQSAVIMEADCELQLKPAWNPWQVLRNVRNVCSIKLISCIIRKLNSKIMNYLQGLETWIKTT